MRNEPSTSRRSARWAVVASAALVAAVVGPVQPTATAAASTARPAVGSERVVVGAVEARGRVPVTRGSYRGTVARDGAVITFKVDGKRRVTGWRATVTMACFNDPFSPLTYIPVPLRLPTTKIPASGRLSRSYQVGDGPSASGALLTVTAKFKGSRARSGTIVYKGPACSGTFAWRADRR